LRDQAREVVERVPTGMLGIDQSVEAKVDAHHVTRFM